MFRIVKRPRGYVVEVKRQRRKWLFFTEEYWEVYVHAAGLSDVPWHHSTYEYAMMNLQNKVKWDTINSRYETHR